MTPQWKCFNDGRRDHSGSLDVSLAYGRVEVLIHGKQPVRLDSHQARELAQTILAMADDVDARRARKQK